MDHEPTHHIPPELQAKLAEAKAWYDKRQEMVDANFPDAGAWTDSVADGCELLAGIVEMCDKAWGFA